MPTAAPQDKARHDMELRVVTTNKARAEAEAATHKEAATAWEREVDGLRAELNTLRAELVRTSSCCVSCDAFARSALLTAAASCCETGLVGTASVPRKTGCPRPHSAGGKPKRSR